MRNSTHNIKFATALNSLSLESIAAVDSHSYLSYHISYYPYSLALYKSCRYF